MRRATASPRSGSEVQTDAPRPYSVRLARLTAAASVLDAITAATGPKVSSLNRAISGVTPVTTVPSKQ